MENIKNTNYPEERLKEIAEDAHDALKHLVEFRDRKLINQDQLEDQLSLVKQKIVILSKNGSPEADNLKEFLEQNF